MRQMWRLLFQIRGLFGSTKADAEMERELSTHVAFLEEELLREGVTPIEARRRARIRIGGVEQTRMLHRAERGLPLLESLFADLCFGWRQLMKRKVTTTAAVMSLGLAMGACVTAFRLVDALFLRPLPVAHANRLYGVFRIGPDLGSGSEQEETSLEYPLFVAMRDAAKNEADLMAVSYIRRRDVTYQSATEMEKAQVQYVSGSMFGTFGLQPALGRLLMPSDDQTPGGHPVTVITYDYWVRRFNRDSGVLGRVVHMGNASSEMGSNAYQIVGVTPKGFSGTEPGTMTEIFLPTVMSASVLQKTNAWLRVLVSLKPGVKAEPVNARINTVFQLDQQERVKRYQERGPQYVERFLSWHTQLKPSPAGISTMQEDYAMPLCTLCLLAILVLMIACVNVANLMSGQATARMKEMAVRLALGAGRGRLVRLMTLQSLLLGTIATGLGIVFAAWSAPFVVSMIGAPGSPVQLALAIGWRTVAFAAFLTLNASLIFGLVPALRASAAQPVAAMKGGEEKQVRLRWLQGMVAAQVAFCLLVLFLAGLFVSTFKGLVQQALGFEPENLITLVGSSQQVQSAETWTRIQERLRSAPGVKDVSLSSVALLSGETFSGAIAVAGVSNEAPAQFLAVSPGWMQTMGMSMRSGRDLRETTGDPGEAVVSETFVRRYLGNGNPIGKIFEATGAQKHRLQVIGVVRDALYQNMRDGILPVFYIPYQWANAKDGMLRPLHSATLVVRTIGTASGTNGEMLTRILAQEQPDLHVSEIRTETELMQAQTVRERLLAVLSSFFAGVALLLATIGLYGVLYYSVVQREREIGIRIALGAAASNIVRVVTARVVAMVLLGSAAGLVAGLSSMRFLSCLLYQVKGTDLSVMALPTLVLLSAALLAALPVLWRAVRINPVVMLRSE